MFRIHKFNTIIQIRDINEKWIHFVSFTRTDVKLEREKRCKGRQRGSEIGEDDEKEKDLHVAREGEAC